MTDAEIWAGYLAGATAAKASVPASLPGGVIGRSIAIIATGFVHFWLKHRNTLVPVLTNLAIAACDAVAAQLANIKAVDPPGPR